MSDELETSDRVEILYEWNELKSAKRRERRRLITVDGEYRVVKKEQVDYGGGWKRPDHIEDERWDLVADEEHDFELIHND